jgi:hypothetical protein
MSTEDYKDLLKSVGITTFVEYYDVFKAYCFDPKNEQIRESFSENGETWNKESSNTKASKGKKIFQNGQEEAALFYIVHEASKVSDEIKEEAKRLLSNEKHPVIDEERYKEFFKDNMPFPSEFKEVKEYARKLYDFINEPKNRTIIEEKHKLNAKSQEIQEIISPKLQELGFESEKKGLFKEYQLRPDYYKKLSENTGIIVEVERGRTLPNNMDLIDIWKCHLCKEANYLFLVVPIIRQNKKGKPEPTYVKVVERLQSFFLKENYINVDALFIFGY